MVAELDSLFDQIKAFDRPPVETWFPETTVDFDIRIAGNGDWYHEGDIIPRRKLVKLFSTVLALRDGGYFLVTPSARFRIKVDDLPFMAVELRIAEEKGEQSLFFRTNTDEVVRADAEHFLKVETDLDTGQPAPSIHVRDGLKARLTRAVYYELADLCVARDHGAHTPGVYSAGCFFPLQ